MTLDQPLRWMPAHRIAGMIHRGDLSAAEVMAYCFSRIAQLEPMLHAFITVSADHARERARTIDSLPSAARVGTLLGAPFSAKDNIFTKSVRTTMASKLFETHQPSTDALVIERLAAAGGAPVGKANLPGVLDVGPIRQSGWHLSAGTPADLRRTCGGSEWRLRFRGRGRTGADLIGTDDGGSIRLPAALDGVFGLHPSPGRVPMEGCVIGQLVLGGRSSDAQRHRCRAVSRCREARANSCRQVSTSASSDYVSPGRRNTRSPPSTTFGSSKSPKELPSRWSRRAQSSKIRGSRWPTPRAPRRSARSRPAVLRRPARLRPSRDQRDHSHAELAATPGSQCPAGRRRGYELGTITEEMDRRRRRVVDQIRGVHGENTTYCSRRPSTRWSPDHPGRLELSRRHPRHDGHAVRPPVREVHVARQSRGLLCGIVAVRLRRRNARGLAGHRQAGRRANCTACRAGVRRPLALGRQAASADRIVACLGFREQWKQKTGLRGGLGGV